MAQYKIVITDVGWGEHELEEAELRDSGLDYELIRLDGLNGEDLVPQLEGADALMVQWAKIDRRVIESLSNCKVISRFGIGVDMVDLKAAGEHGIPVANVADYCIDEVSTHTMTFLLMLNRHLLTHHNHVAGKNWGKSGVAGGPPSRLSEQTLGVVGLGNIGRAVVRKAQGFGLKILGYDPYLTAERAEDLGVEKVELDDLLRRSDYVTLHCPLTDETRHIINAERLALMKPTAYLINMSRGPVVDQPALYEALKNGVIAGAGLDVLEQEPPDANDPLLTLDNVLLSPHTSSWSKEAIVELRRGVARNVVDALQGRRPRSVVNRKELNW
jgi:D-3-phosphoglycerate dehydrogenase